MTVVVGVISAGGVLLAGDSQSSGDNAIRMRLEPKTFQFSETIAIACCGSGRFGQIVTTWMDDYLEEPYPPLMADEHDWMKRVFIPALTDCLEEHGHLHRYEENNVVQLGDSAFLIAIRDRLFAVEPDMAVDEPEFAFESLGSGSDVAMGAMHKATNGSTTFIEEKDLLDIATGGVKAASGLTAWVGGNMTTVYTVKYTKEELAYAKGMLQ